MGPKTSGHHVRTEKVQELTGVAFNAMQKVGGNPTLPEIASATFTMTSAMIHALLDNSDGTDKELNRMSLTSAINQLFILVQPSTQKLN
jgi:hypothetical protein